MPRAAAAALGIRGGAACTELERAAASCTSTGLRCPLAGRGPCALRPGAPVPAPAARSGFPRTLAAL
eukprot:6342455-Pyramimonas_sp.AAC.1